MKIIKSEQNEGKYFITLELNERQNNFIIGVGLGILIQQGALFFASERDEAVFGGKEEKETITPPEDASS
jgi:hypothetical protein